MGPPALSRPVKKMTDKQIVKKMNQILDYFNRYAISDHWGWDWPTMNLLFPYVCGKYRELKAEGAARLEQNNGIFDGHQYQKTDRGWKLVEELVEA